jgi:hypothetical protein
MLWDQLWYAFVKKGHCQAFHLFLRSVFCLLVIPPDFDQPKSICLIQKVWNACLTKFCFSFNSPMAIDRCPLQLLPCTIVLPSLNSCHHFLTFPLFISCSACTQICACEFLLHEHFLVFKNHMTDSFSQVAGFSIVFFSPLNATLNPICHMLALLGAHHILYVSRIRVNDYSDFLGGGGWWHHTSPLLCKWEVTTTLSYIQLAPFLQNKSDMCLLAYRKCLEWGQWQCTYTQCSCYAWSVLTFWL